MFLVRGVAKGMKIDSCDGLGNGDGKGLVASNAGLVGCLAV